MFDVSFDWIDPFGISHRLETQTVNGLAAGASVPLAYAVDTTQFPAGPYQVVLAIDTEDAVAEANEADNLCQALVQVGVKVQPKRRGTSLHGYFDRNLRPAICRFLSIGVTHTT